MEGADAKARDDLRADLNAEYAALVRLVSEFDGRLLVVKGWSVTLSLAGIGLGFQQQHYALFLLAALTAAAFWTIDALMKGHQMRYYPRMAAIEAAAYHLNHVRLTDEWVESSPRIDWYWGFPSRKTRKDWRNDPPTPRPASNVRALMRRPWWLPQVLLPHLLAVLLGVALYVGAVLDAPGMDSLDL